MHQDYNNSKQNVSHHGNGFMAGLIVGATVATVLSTKRGRAMLKELAAMGLAHLDSFLEEEAVGSLQEEMEEPPVTSTNSVSTDVQVEEVVPEVYTEEMQAATVKKVTPLKPKRNFFKGLKKSKN